MSEVSRTLKRLQVISKELESREGTRYGALAALHRELHDSLSLSIDKAEKRLSQTDPVTGKPLYGEAMAAKVRTARQLFDDLIIRYENTLQLAVDEEEREKTEQQRLHDCSVEAIAAVDTYSLHHSVPQEPANEETRKEAEEELHAQAIIAREQRIEARRQKHMAADNLRAQRFDMVRNLNNRRVSVAAALQGLKDANSPMAALSAMKCVSGILQRIVQHPDDAKLRRLRIANEKLRDEITGYSGGVELLVSVGFHAELVLRPDGGDEDEVVAEHADDDTVLASAHLPLLEQVSSYCYLIMEEPDITSTEGMMMWSQWFDGLKADVSKILEYISKYSSVAT